MNRIRIEDYAAGAGRLRGSIAGLTRDQLLAFPVPGTWSIQQIVLHVVDSDLIGSDRMKRVVAEDNPRLIGVDESRFAANLFYHDLDIQLACDLFETNRALTAQLLRRLPDATFERVGQHSERGPLTLVQLLETFTNHLDHHLKFIHEKRRLLGNPP